MFPVDDRPIPDVVNTLAASIRFRTWTTVLVRTLFVDDLRGRGPWLVLAPTDEAFALLPDGLLEQLFRPSAIEDLIDLAELHIVRSTGPVARSLSRSFAFLGDGTRVLARKRCSNGAISVVDRVSLPPRIAHAWRDDVADVLARGGRAVERGGGPATDADHGRMDARVRGEAVDAAIAATPRGLS